MRDRTGTTQWSVCTDSHCIVCMQTLAVVGAAVIGATGTENERLVNDSV
jgi:hypothetical protein